MKGTISDKNVKQRGDGISAHLHAMVALLKRMKFRNVEIKREKEKGMITRTEVALCRSRFVET